MARSLQDANGRLQQQAYLDPLTGLSNRVHFEERLQHAVTACERRAAANEARCKLAIVCIDLDGFKSVNDSFGHAAGDLVLAEVAQRLRRTARQNDVIARMGGDEFLLMMDGVDGPESASALAHRLIESLSQPIQLSDEHPVQISASLGIALFPDHGPANKLVTRADAAMYAAKRSGGSVSAVYGAQLDADLAGEAALLCDLKQALGRGEFSLNFQPKVDARQYSVVGAEALLRWRHPQRGMVPPSTFIPLAERHGMIVPIGNWVIEEVCRQMHTWAGSGFRMPVAINVSAHQLRQPDFVSRLEAALLRHQVDASQLLCEVTETAAIEDVEATQRTFVGLDGIGIFLSIDDFGTGYSSLSCLRQMPARQLKIDRSFVKDLESNADARAVVDGIIRLAHALGLTVVAEGVETATHSDILTELGCDELQGFYYARPMAGTDLPTWVANHEKNVVAVTVPGLLPGFDTPRFTQPAYVSDS